MEAPRTDRTLSELVNAAVRHMLAEGAKDLAAFGERAHEPALSFENVGCISVLGKDVWESCGAGQKGCPTG